MTATHETMDLPKGARDDYPILADAATNPALLCWTEAAAALDELDALRSVVMAAHVWHRCKASRFADSTNTVEVTQRWHDAIRGAERNLHEKVAAYLADGLAS